MLWYEPFIVDYVSKFFDVTLICFGNKITLHCTVLNVCKPDFGQIKAAQWLHVFLRQWQLTGIMSNMPGTFSNQNTNEPWAPLIPVWTDTGSRTHPIMTDWFHFQKSDIRLLWSIFSGEHWSFTRLSSHWNTR